MLDSTELARRLCAVMDYREPRLRSVDVAAYCGVSKQTVYEWRTTGRIAKSHFHKLAEVTETPFEFWFEPERGMSKTTRAIWDRLGKLLVRVAVVAILTVVQPLLTFHAEASDYTTKTVFNITQYTLCAWRLLCRLLFSQTFTTQFADI